MLDIEDEVSYLWSTDLTSFSGSDLLLYLLLLLTIIYGLWIVILLSIACTYCVSLCSNKGFIMYGTNSATIRWFV